MLMIGIEPTGSARAAVARLVRTTSEEHGSVKAPSIPPHITLVGRFEERNAAVLLKRLERTCRDLPPFNVILKSIDSFSEPPIIFLRPEREGAFREIHTAIIDVVTEFRTPWSRDSLRNAVKTPREQELFDKYGSPYVKEFYHPHLTLAGPDIAAKNLPTSKPLRRPIIWRAEHITVFQKGEEWTRLAELPLRESNKS
jgi:2'-5' RNA ligase